MPARPMCCSPIGSRARTTRRRAKRKRRAVRGLRRRFVRHRRSRREARERRRRAQRQSAAAFGTRGDVLKLGHIAIDGTKVKANSPCGRQDLRIVRFPWATLLLRLCAASVTRRSVPRALRSAGRSSCLAPSLGGECLSAKVLRQGRVVTSFYPHRVEDRAQANCDREIREECP